jgi:hypothetical protein
MEQTMSPLLSRLLSLFRSDSPKSSPRPRPRREARRRFVLRRPWLEVLEDRALLSAYVVTTTADCGPGSLRDAINQVNADTSHALYASPSNPAVDEIDFNITAGSDTGGGFNATTSTRFTRLLLAPDKPSQKCTAKRRYPGGSQSRQGIPFHNQPRCRAVSHRPAQHAEDRGRVTAVDARSPAGV